MITRIATFHISPIFTKFSFFILYFTWHCLSECFRFYFVLVCLKFWSTLRYAKLNDNSNDISGTQESSLQVTSIVQLSKWYMSMSCWVNFYLVGKSLKSSQKYSLKLWARVHSPSFWQNELHVQKTDVMLKVCIIGDRQGDRWKSCKQACEMLWWTQIYFEDFTESF